MIDRSQPPVIHPVTAVHIPQPILHTLSNGIVVYDINIGKQDVLKLELQFDAGRWQELEPLVSRATAKLLKMGTQHFSADELADKMEYYGTKLRVSDGFDAVTLEVYCLTKHLEAILGIIQDMLLYPTFPQTELDKFIKRNKERLKLDLQKNEVVNYRIFTEEIFGKSHQYGYNSTDELYENIKLESLRQHWARCYTAANCRILVAGKTSAQTIQLLEKYFGNLPKGEKIQMAAAEISPEPSAQKIHCQGNKESLQTSIRIGRRLFTKHHPDYAGFYVLNTILGGYFGARLMQNLREDKGYTYGVYSALEDLKYDGYFYVSTEVGNEVKDDAIAQIYIEMARLRDELIDNEELEMVRSYLMGQYLNGLDGVFNVSSVVSEAVRSEISLDFINELIRVTQTITPQALQALAQKYLNVNELCEIVVF